MPPRISKSIISNRSEKFFRSRLSEWWKIMLRLQYRLHYRNFCFKISKKVQHPKVIMLWRWKMIRPVLFSSCVFFELNLLIVRNFTLGFLAHGYQIKSVAAFRIFHNCHPNLEKTKYFWLLTDCTTNWFFGISSRHLADRFHAKWSDSRKLCSSQCPCTFFSCFPPCFIFFSVFLLLSPRQWSGWLGERVPQI